MQHDGNKIHSKSDVSNNEFQAFASTFTVFISGCSPNLSYSEI
jgi:hypothetical protein